MALIGAFHAQLVIDVPLSLYKHRMLSRVRALSATLGASLSGDSRRALLAALEKLVPGFHVRHVLSAAIFVAVEYFLLFGPCGSCRENYRDIALWPLPRTAAAAGLVGALQGFVSMLFVSPAWNDRTCFLSESHLEITKNRTCRSW